MATSNQDGNDDGISKEDKGLLELEDQDEEDSKYGVIMAATFAVGVTAGSGVLVLPNATAKTGWSGVIVIMLLAIIQTYTGILLGRCWIILQERFPTYKQQTRHPFAAIGYEAFGTPGRVLVTIAVNITIFGILTAFLSIVADNITILLNIHNFNDCYTLLIVGGILCPMFWFGTPKDFWPFAILAALSTGVAALLLLIAVLRETPGPEEKTGTVFIGSSVANYFSGLGVMILAYNGHPAYPTLQHDMKEPRRFSLSLVMAAIVVSAYFLPMMIATYAIHGEDLLSKANIYSVVPPGTAKTISMLLITLHVINATVIFGNPLFQEAEAIIGVKSAFSWRRVAVRTSLLVVIVFTAASVPFFDTILSFMGGTTLVAITMIFPVCFYWKLRQSGSADEQPSIFEKMIFVAILVLAILIGIASTYSNIIVFKRDFRLSAPCYLS